MRVMNVKNAAKRKTNLKALKEKMIERLNA